MRKINLKGISEILSEKELKNVMGGSGNDGCEDGGACDGTRYCIAGSTHGYCSPYWIFWCSCQGKTF